MTQVNELQLRKRESGDKFVVLDIEPPWFVAAGLNSNSTRCAYLNGFDDVGVTDEKFAGLGQIKAVVHSRYVQRFC